MSPEEHIEKAEQILATQNLYPIVRFNMHLAIAAVQKEIPGALSLLKD